jgi:hypothetical protein
MERLSESRTTIALRDVLLNSPAFTPGHRSRGPWSVTRLEEALRAILEQRQVELRITFFFDALDEFDGPPDYISRFVKYLVNRPTGSLTHTKVCFSSRPWDDFMTNFSSGPKLAVEDFTKEDIRYFCTTSFSINLDAKHHSLVSRLADEIVLRASGVFLWASLILKELVAAFNGGQTPSLEDLLRLLQSVPTELSNYYNFLIQRIPKNLRWKTYALLEVVVRARTQEGPRLDYTWKTVLISDSPNWLAAQQILGNLDNRGDEDPSKEPRRDILLWGGGLVSVSADALQLMHQTVYEFVTKLDFKDQVLGSMSKATHENGHSFHFKSFLTFYFHEVPFLLTATTRETKDLRSSINYGAKAEETTGRSCQPFLDSVPSHTIAEFGKRLIKHLEFDGHYLGVRLERHLIRSHLGFATFLRLRLYLQDRVLRDPGRLSTIAASEDLLQLVTLAVGLGETYTYQRLLSTASFLLDNGHGKSRIWDLFPYVLEPIFRPHQFDLWDQPRHSGCLEAFDRLAALFLEHDQRCASRPLLVGKSDVHWVKPIHTAPPLTTIWLLDHGANPNEQDWLGRTPLDHILLHKWRELDSLIIIPDDYHRRAELLKHIYQSTSILLQHGVRRQYASDDDWKRFVEKLRDKGFDVSDFPAMVPKTQEATSTARSISPPAPTTSVLTAPILSDPPTTKPKSTFSRRVKHLFGKWRQTRQLNPSTRPKTLSSLTTQAGYKPPCICADANPCDGHDPGCGTK